MEAIIRQCDCTHTQQDKLHGKNLRVWNPRMVKGRLKGYRCTVCGKQTDK